ncbi:MAG: tripartite tricarboxylate transporter substrate binding protein [Pseudolabrys sp.]|nr:tripartite tricarboxylate transporter substrate binding protein [Pseudolabrys sp.]
MKYLKTIAAPLFASALMAAAAIPARAEFPEKPVEMTVLFGSTAKTIAQVLADEMGKSLGKPVVPVFRPGAGGAVGYKHVGSQPADGYSIVWNSNSITSSHLRGNMTLSYKDFTPIARVSVESLVVAVKADSPWKTLKDIAAAANKSSNKLKIGTAAKGSFTHVTAAAVFDALGIGDKVIYVPIGGQGKVPAELVAGRLDAAVQFPGQFVSFVKAGEARMIAMTAGERLAAFPDVPTAMEQGVDVDMSMWRGLAAPAGTPPAVIMKLQAAAKDATESDTFKKTLATLGANVSYMDHDAFGKLIVQDDGRLDKIMGGLGLKKEPKS